MMLHDSYGIFPFHRAIFTEDKRTLELNLILPAPLSFFSMLLCNFRFDAIEKCKKIKIPSLLILLAPFHNAIFEKKNDNHEMGRA